jgi:hypothetical protein
MKEEGYIFFDENFHCTQRQNLACAVKHTDDGQGNFFHRRNANCLVSENAKKIFFFDY